MVRASGFIPLVMLLVPAVCFCQLSPSRCDSSRDQLADCIFLTRYESPIVPVFAADTSPVVGPAAAAEIHEATSEGQADSGKATTTAVPPPKEGFHWSRALAESFTFLVIEQSYVVHTDFRWVVAENGIPFNHYWRDYMQSLTSWWRAGWSAGEDPLYNYVGHPIQGAVTSYIQIQNDPQSEKLEFANTKAYWRSRLKATIWNTVYSTQWSMGPLSEMTVEKYGTKVRPPWNANGVYPCNTKTCYSGVGKVNLVMTPVGGFGWMLAEDILDKKIAEEFVETHTDNRFLIDTVRCALNPIRGGANILHGHHPWYRIARDGPERPLLSQKRTSPEGEAPPPQTPNHGDVLVGYSHSGTSHCERLASGTLISCDPLSANASNLSGWKIAAEKKYLPYFGVVADFSGEYGDVAENDFMFGPRGGASIGRFRPFAQVLFGAVHAHETGSPAVTSFAEDLGLGLDFRLARLISWRDEVDELKTADPDFERRNLRLSSGLAIRF